MVTHFGIYSNPANTVIHIVSKLENDFTLQLYNLLGEEMMEAKVGDRSTDVSEVPVGMYVARLNVGGRGVVRKVVVQR